MSPDSNRDSPTPPAAHGLPCAPEAVDEFLSEPTDGVRAVLKNASGPFMVLGAGGKIGLHLSVMLRRALDQLGRSDRVVAVSRFTTLHDQDAFHSRHVETIACDLSDAEALKTLPEAGTVFFLAGVKFGTANAPELLERMNVIMPRLVAERFKRGPIVAFSTGCVYPLVRPEDGGATEATPVNPPGDYARSCLARETAFAEASKLHGTPVAFIRLNYSIEFRYGVLVDIARKVHSGEPVDVNMGFVNVIWQRDAVAQSIQALSLAASPAIPVNITGPDVLSVRELAMEFGRRLGQVPRIVGTEGETCWLNNATMSHRLWGPPATPVDTMIAWIVAWVRNSGTSWGKPTGFEKRDGKF